MKNILIFSVKAIIFLFLMSCNKEEAPPNLNIDHGGYKLNEDINITFTPAIKDCTFTYNSIIPIKGNISADFNLHGYSISIAQGSNKEIVFSKNQHTHGSTIMFDYSWQNLINQNDSLKLTLNVYGNHSGNHIEKSIQFFTKK